MVQLCITLLLGTSTFLPSFMSSHVMYSGHLWLFLQAYCDTLFSIGTLCNNNFSFSFIIKGVFQAL